jgi:hypothetical protein
VGSSKLVSLYESIFCILQLLIHLFADKDTILFSENEDYKRKINESKNTMIHCASTPLRPPRRHPAKTGALQGGLPSLPASVFSDGKTIMRVLFCRVPVFYYLCSQFII